MDKWIGPGRLQGTSEHAPALKSFSVGVFINRPLRQEGKSSAVKAPSCRLRFPVITYFYLSLGEHTAEALSLKYAITESCRWQIVGNFKNQDNLLNPHQSDDIQIQSSHDVRSGRKTQINTQRGCRLHPSLNTTHAIWSVWEFKHSLHLTDIHKLTVQLAQTIGIMTVIAETNSRWFIV